MMNILSDDNDASGWNDGKEIHLTVTTPADLQRILYKTVHTTLRIDAVGVELDSADERDGTIEELIDELHKETSMLIGGSEQGQAFLVELASLKEVSSPWKLHMTDPSGNATVSARPSEGGGEDPQLTIQSGPGLKDLLPKNDVIISISQEGESVLTLRIVERPGVSLGSTVFHGATLLAQHLVTCMPRGIFKGKRVLELGAGTGITGLFAAALGADVTITDLPVLVPVLQTNVEANQAVVSAAGGSAKACAFAWGDDISVLMPPFDYVIGSDVVYSHLQGDMVMDSLLQSLVASCSRDSIVLMHHQSRLSLGEFEFFKQCQELFDVHLVGITAQYAAEGLDNPDHPVNTLPSKDPIVLGWPGPDEAVKIARGGGSAEGEGGAVHERSASHGMPRLTLR